MSEFYVIQESSNDQYYFTLKAENNKVVLTSELYPNVSSAEKGIDSVRRNSPYDSNYKRKISDRKKNYFVLVAANGEAIGVSEEYSSFNEMEDGIKVVRRIGPNAVTRPRT